ncbi:DUF86 domain-containing protein [Pseudorhizobium flavum]|uniref:Uncharacterized protein with HEPN domain n=1 Tax=Pseudorhizobium flavum TaxID=1335061 RepID=A0A7W9YZI3_9HYPH|nr:HepT-like ribonuclease domain-containing protein [Pseudorhizobium flavum]MBB6181215.1 uncharacterized protein with HEPN domain [Pseudorhizobium flavum]CAD6601145.1 hypothetical protein RFYW14_00832 [Pseudorhizobium flavum]
MARDVLLILDDILEMITLIERTVRGRTRKEIERDHILNLGIQRAIEIISEASKHVPQELLEQAPDIPWRSIRGMGNILRHEYHRIADDVIRDVVDHDLPLLKQAILAMKTSSGE